jgi:hypothetical protein|tara:strand:- start:4159 stop:12810 length:8652 start_codon:yes stop_codon:yes gene_type:complete
MATLEEILQSRLEKNSNVFSDSTSTNTSQGPLSDFANIGPAQAPSSNTQEKSMYKGLGSGLWDFTREFGEGFVDSVAFGIPSAASDWEPEDGRDTEAGKWGGDIGAALGFLGPFMAGKFGVSMAARGIAGASSSVRTGKRIIKGVDSLADDAGKIAGIEFAPNQTLHKGFQSIIQKDIEKKGMSYAFKHHVLDDALIKPLNKFDDAFGSASARNKFFDQMDDELMKDLTEHAASKGFNIAPDAAKGINGVVKNAMAEAGGRPISSLSGMVAKKLGDKAPASLYSHMFEEAIVFAAVDNVIAGIDAVAGEHEYDPLSTTTHALILGHVLGAIRFVPGGLAGGVIGAMNPKKMINNVSNIMSKTSAQGYNLSTKKGQNAVTRQFAVLSQINSMHLTAKGGGNVSISKIMQDYVARGNKEIGKKLTSSEKARLRKLGSTYDTSTLIELAQTGTKEQKKIAAEVMRDVVKTIHGQAKREWRGEFMKAVRQDLIGGGEGGIGSMPRMFAGGIAMSGGPGILFDEDLTMGDKARSLLIGAFLLKHGKELTYKNYNLKAWERYEGTFTFGNKPLGGFSERFQQTNQLIKSLGGKFEGDAKGRYLWGQLERQMIIDNRTKFDSSGSDKPFSNPENIQDILDISNFQYNEKSGRIFVEDINTKVNEKQVLDNRKGKQVANDSSWRNVYEASRKGMQKDSIIGENKRLKQWNELSVGQKRVYIRLMESNGYKPGKRGLKKLKKKFYDANIDMLNKITNRMVEDVKSLIDTLEIQTEIPYTFDSETGRYKFKTIDYLDIIERLDSVATNKLNEYNSMVETLNTAGIHQKEGTVKIAEKNRPSSEKIEAFVLAAEKSKRKANEIFGTAEESFFEYSDSWFKNTMDHANQFGVIEKSIDLLPAFIRENGEVARIFRVEAEGSSYGGIVDKITIEGDANPGLQQRLNAALEMVKMTSTAVGPFLQGEKTITKKEALKLFEKLEEANIFMFREVQRWDSYQQEMYQEAKEMIRENVYSKGTVLIDGKWRKLNDTDITEIELLEDNQVVIPGTFTMRPLYRELFDVGRTLNNFKDTVEGKQLKRIEDLVEFAEQSGADTKTIESIKELMKFSNGEARTFEQIINVFNKEVGKFVKTAEGGVLDVSPFGEKIALTMADVTKIVHGIESIQNGVSVKSTKRMILELREDLKRIGLDPNILDREGEINAKKYILAALVKGNAYRKDAIDIVALANQLGVYNSYKNEFKQNEPGKEGTTWENIRKKFQKLVQKDWIESESEIQSLYNTLLKEKNVDPKDINPIDLGQIFTKYNFKVFANNTEMKDLQYLQLRFEASGLQGGFNGRIDKFTEAFIKDYKENNKDVDADNITNISYAITNFMAEQASNMKITRYKFNAGNTDSVVHSRDTVKRTVVMDYIHKAVGDGVDIAILDYEGKGFNGYNTNLNNLQYRQASEKALYNGKYSSVDNKFDFMETMETPTNTKYFSFQYGTNKYKYLIENNPQNLRTLGDNYIKYIDDLISKKIIDKNDRADILEEVGLVRKNKSGSKEVYVLEYGDSITANKQIYRLLSDMIQGQMIGETKWWSENIRNAKGNEAAKVLKRLKLFDNLSAKRYDQQTIRELANILKNNKADFNASDRLVKSLNDFADGKWKEVVIADEGGNNQWEHNGTKLGIDDIHSVLKQEVKNYEDIVKNKQYSKAIRDGAKKELDTLKEDIDSGVMNDASNVNGVTFVSESAFEAAAFLSGKPNWKELGGIKPIVVSVGEGQLLINKTAMVRDSNIANMFKQKGNENLHFITFTSASKQIGKSYDKPLSDSVDLFGGSDLTPGMHTIRPENLQIISSKDMKKKATVGLNHTTDLTVDNKRRFKQYVLNDKLKEVRNKSDMWKDVLSSWQQIAQFKLWRKSKNVKDTTSEQDNATDGILDLMADNNIHPGILRPQLESMWKKFEIDPLFKTEIIGGQSVMVPEIGLRGVKRLRDTIIVGDKIFQTGEVEIAHAKRFDSFDFYNVTLVDTKSDIKMNKKPDFDNYIKLSKLVSLRKLRKNGAHEELGELHDYIQKEYKGKYKVLIISERQPNTKHSSIMPTALRGFKSERDGNVIVLNQSDVKRAAEGDFDIDTANFFWNMPHEVMLNYIKNRTIVRDSRNVPMQGNESYKNLDLSDAKSVNDYNALGQKASIMRGVTMKSRGVLDWLTSNNSNQSSQYKVLENMVYDKNTGEPIAYGKATSKTGLLMKMGENRYIGLRNESDLRNVYQKIADYNQHILDSDNGYNTSIFKDSETLYKRLFFGSDGAFQVYTVSKVISPLKNQKATIGLNRLVPESGGISNAEMKALYNHVFTPYKDLRQLSTATFDKGQQSKVSYKQLLSGIAEYNSSMHMANANIAKELGLKPDTDVLGDFAINAKIESNQKGNAFKDNVMLYDSILAEVMHISEIGWSNNKSEIPNTTIRNGQEIDNLMINQDAMKDYAGAAKSSSEKFDIINSIEQRIRRLQKLRNVNSDATSLRMNTERIEKLKEVQEKIREEIIIPENILNDIAERKVSQEIGKYFKEYREPMDGEAVIALRKKMREEVKNGNIVTTVKPHLESEFVHALAMVEGFGRYSQMNFQQLGMDRTNFIDLSNNARNLKNDFSRAWSDWRNERESNFENGDVQIRWINEGHIYQYFLKRMQEESHVFETMQERNIYLAKIMTPSVDMTSVVSYRGRWFPTPESKRIDKFIALAFRFNAQNVGKEMQSEFMKQVGKSYELSERLLNGEQGIKLGEQTVDKNSFYLDPFTYTANHSRSELLNVLNPATIEYSRLSQFQQMHKLFGTGFLRDTVAENVMASIPIGVSGNAGHRTINRSLKGLSDMDNNLEDSAFIISPGKNSVFDNSGQLYDYTPYGKRKEKYSPSKWTKQENKRNKRFCD